jgi:elongation factor P--(R)-beta-lysine ligase
VYADRRPFLLARAAVAAAVRDWFAAQGFIEIEPACLQVSPGAEAHLVAFATELVGSTGASRRLYLHASPEFSCKKLLAAGEEKIFSLCRVFRNRDDGPLHSPEFTMLEWYRAGAPLAAMAADCAALLCTAARAAGARTLIWRGARADPFAEPELVSVSEAFAREAGVDLPASMPSRDETDVQALAEQARRVGVRVAPDDSWSDLFSKILSEKVEPRLGHGRPTILTAYPACEAALARRDAADPRFAERLELYCCGVELANAFGELTDAVEQRRRLTAEMDLRERVYGERYPLDEEFLAALEFMPEAAGCALGFDRLVMLAAGAERIDQVAWTPVVSADAST